MAVIMIAVSKAGKAKARSELRMISASTQPPAEAARAPSGTPMPAPRLTASSETESEVCVPAMIIDSTSRPKASVPSQWVAEGWASLCRMSSLLGG